MSAATAVSLTELAPLTPRLEVLDADDQRTVFINGHVVGRYECADRGTERVLVTQLAEVLRLPDREIAAAFGLHPVTLSRLRAQVQQGGAAALMPRRTGPTGAHKMTPRLEARCRQLRAQGYALREIAARVSRPDRSISHVTVAALFKATPSPSTSQALPLEADAPERDESIRPLSPPPAPPLALTHELRPTRYAGALLLYAALARLDVWGVFRELAATTGPSRMYGWAQTVAAIICGFALRFRSIEDLKNALRTDLGVLLGTAQAPTVLVLRQKIKALAESVDPVTLARALFRRYVALEPVWEGLYYVDGHFCPYYGQYPTPQGWNPHRRLAVPGHTDVYLHDVRGRVLFFISRPLNDSLSRAIPAAVAEIRQVHGPGPFTLVFDRGGFSADAFRFLQAEGIGFLTYLAGRKRHRHVPVARFHRSWFAFEGKRHVYAVFEKTTRVSRAGTFRTILFLGDEDQQIPVVTNLAPPAVPAKIVHCLQLRWRQENSLKFLHEHYAVEQIIQYGADPEAQPRRVPNLKRKTLTERVRQVTAEIHTLEAELGRAVDTTAARDRPTTRGLKMAHRGLRQQLAARRQVLARLHNRLRHTPGQIDAAEAGKTRSLLREDRRLIVNALKLVAANAERLLALHFNRYYKAPNDVFSIFRGLLQLPGTVRSMDGDRLEVCLHRPDSTKVAQALAALLADLNREQPRLLGQGPILRFTLPDSP